MPGGAGATFRAPEDVPWLFGVARHQLANARDDPRVAVRDSGSYSRGSAPRSVRGRRDPRVDALRDALRRLPDADAGVLRLLAWEGLSQREAAVVLGTSENAVALRASRARRRLAELLDRFPTDPDMEG